METNKTNKRLIAEDVCRKFPETPTLTLAKKIYKENPEIYLHVEDARGIIRIIRGSRGDIMRKNTADKTLYDKTPRPLNPFKLPESYAHKKEPFHLPKSSKKILLLSDIHIPYHDIEAIESAANYGLENNVDTVFLNGDVLDFYGLSFHEKDPRNRPTIATELEMGREFFKWLRSKFKKQTIYYITGNHEFRLERYLRVKAPELLDVSEFKLPFLLNLAEVGVIPLEHKQKVYVGKLLVEHGDKMRGTGGVTPARTLLLKFKRSVICGHFHRTSQANSKVYDGDTYMAWSTGCLCELEPDYMEVNEHNHGFAIIEVKDNGNYVVQNKQMFNGNVY